MRNSAKREQSAVQHLRRQTERPLGLPPWCANSRGRARSPRVSRKERRGFQMLNRQRSVPPVCDRAQSHCQPASSCHSARAHTRPRPQPPPLWRGQGGRAQKAGRWSLPSRPTRVQQPGPRAGAQHNPPRRWFPQRLSSRLPNAGAQGIQRALERGGAEVPAGSVGSRPRKQRPTALH